MQVCHAVAAAWAHDDCAQDMQNGLNAFGGFPDDMPLENQLLAGGGDVIMPCPACTEDGEDPHILTVRKVGGEFVVLAED